MRTQLRSPDAVVRWATILAAVATRIERLKHLARERADEPATVELTLEEIRMIVRSPPPGRSVPSAHPPKR
jgi:hypothetical protein